MAKDIMAKDPKAKKMASAGRNGDTEMAHVTPGEVVIPLNVQTPELMAAVSAAFEQAGVPMDRYVVQGDEESVQESAEDMATPGDEEDMAEYEPETPQGEETTQEGDEDSQEAAAPINPKTGKPEFFLDAIAGAVAGKAIGSLMGGGDSGGGGGAVMQSSDPTGQNPAVSSLIQNNPFKDKNYLNVITPAMNASTMAPQTIKGASSQPSANVVNPTQNTTTEAQDPTMMAIKSVAITPAPMSGIVAGAPLNPQTGRPQFYGMNSRNPKTGMKEYAAQADVKQRLMDAGYKGSWDNTPEAKAERAKWRAQGNNQSIWEGIAKQNKVVAPAPAYSTNNFAADIARAGSLKVDPSMFGALNTNPQERADVIRGFTDEDRALFGRAMQSGWNTRTDGGRTTVNAPMTWTQQMQNPEFVNKLFAGLKKENISAPVLRAFGGSTANSFYSGNPTLTDAPVKSPSSGTGGSGAGGGVTTPAKPTVPSVPSLNPTTPTTGGSTGGSGTGTGTGTTNTNPLSTVTPAITRVSSLSPERGTRFRSRRYRGDLARSF